MLRCTLLVLTLLIFTAPAFAAPPVTNGAVGAQAIWFDDNTKPSDFELGATGAAALSQHIAAVGSAWYGIDNSYLRGSLGVRLTATDPNAHDFAVGVGIQRHLCSEPSLRPEEFAGDVSVAWKPWPLTQKRLLVALQGSYGFDSNTAAASAGLRYALGGGSD